MTLMSGTPTRMSIGRYVVPARLRKRRSPVKSVDAVRMALALEDSARDVRAGHSLRQALVAQPVLWPSFALRNGEPLLRALDAWATRATDTDERLVACAVVLAAHAGGATAQALDSAAMALHERLAIRADVRAQAATALASAVIVGGLPFFVLALSLVGDGRTRDVLLHTAAGRLCIAIGLALDLVGLAWMRRLIRSASRS